MRRSRGWRQSWTADLSLKSFFFETTFVGRALAPDRVDRFPTLSGLRRKKKPAHVARHSKVETDGYGACTSRHWNVELHPSHCLQGSAYPLRQTIGGAIGDLCKKVCSNASATATLFYEKHGFEVRVAHSDSADFVDAVETNPDIAIHMPGQGLSAAKVRCRESRRFLRYKSNVNCRMNWRGSTMRYAFGVPSGKAPTGWRWPPSRRLRALN